VPVGGQLAVAPGDRFEGSVSGGCVEAEVISEAAGVMAAGTPELLEFGVAEETAWRAGLPCGGRIEVLLEPLERGRDAADLDRLIAARCSRTRIGVVTELATGHRRLYEGASAAPPEVEACMASGESRMVEMAGGRAFVHAFVPAIRLVIVGATHVGQVLADLARRVGYGVVVVDPRTAFASPERMGSVPVVTEWPETSLERLALDPRTAVVALTHTADLDDEALREALRSDCFYVGALGSKRTHMKRVERLETAGVGAADLARIRAPVGLAIGAKGPSEIAVSILAEIIKAARGAL
jgi:xanthine dehydrogenase accessory factor